VGRYAEGILLLAIALIPLQTAAFLWRARLLGEWTGAQARLAEIVVDLTVVICVSELLGAVHLYRVGFVVGFLGAIGVAAIWAVKRSPRNDALVETAAKPVGPAPQKAAPRLANVAALISVAVVVGEWMTKTVAAYHHGILSTDSLWYHLPFAARFVQEGSITPLHYVDSEAVTVFFPASSELFHSFGMLVMGNDVLSPLLNMLWLGLALLASWCIGRPFGVAPIAVVGSAILFATPGLVGTQPGGAYDDVVGLALLLSSVALLVNAKDLSKRSGDVAWVLAGFAAGLALGTKYTLIGPIAALTVGVWFLLKRGERAVRMILWLGALVLTGSFWYFRNLFVVGNPLPSLALKLGPISLPSPHIATPTSTVAQFVFDKAAWSGFFLPGLRVSLGPAWWALVGLSCAGLVLAIVTGNRLQRVLGCVGAFAGVVFVFTPQFLAVYHSPVFFVDNVRYADDALILGLVLLPTCPHLAPWRISRWVLGAYMAILVAIQFDAGIWPTTFFTEKFEIPVRGSDFVVGLLIGVAVAVIGAAGMLYRRRSPNRRTQWLAWVLIVAVIVVLGFPLQQSYLRDRYTGTSAGDLPGVSQYFQHVGNARIAAAGPLSYLQYPLYGASLSNYVQFMGVRGPDGSYSSFSSCKQWRQAVIDGRYSYVSITTALVRTKADVISEAPPELKWTKGLGSTFVLRGVSFAGAPFHGYLGYFLYRVDAGFSTSGCHTA
jgi:hypothetical protein